MIELNWIEPFGFSLAVICLILGSQTTAASVLGLTIEAYLEYNYTLGYNLSFKL